MKTSAQNVHSASEWGVLLALLAAAGAGAWPRGAPASAYTGEFDDLWKLDYHKPIKPLHNTGVW